jgi:hypothetical protein
MDANGRILMEDFSRQVEGKMLEPLILQFFLAERACLSFGENALQQSFVTSKTCEPRP